jgi:Phytanoyl-CoA dioxygenase (PhyH)
MKPSVLFEEQGFALKFGVFSAQEIESMRERVEAQFKLDTASGNAQQVMKTQAQMAKGDLLSKEHLRSILLDDRILFMVRDLLQSAQLVYFGDSTYQIGTGARGFHRDATDRTFGQGLDYEPGYNLLRVGIYLQDHKKYSGGLKVKAKSHKQQNGKTLFLDTEAGDVAAWSLKTLHSGNAVRLKGLPGISIDNSSIENRIPSFLKCDQQKERMSLFMTFGVAGKFVDHYIENYMLKRADVVGNLEASPYDAEAIQLCKDKGIALIEPLKTQ